MKVLLLVVALCGLAAAKQEMLETNRVAPMVGTTTCDECKSLVTRFVEAAKDPRKLQELKMLLNVLCHETSYVDECRMFVSKLDIFIAKLAPYMKNPEAVCKKFHMCSNSKIDAFHRIGLLYAKRYVNKMEGNNDLVCNECMFAAGELRRMIEDEKKQQSMKRFISQNVCAHIPKYQGACDLLLEEFMPELIQELDALLQDTKKTCQDIGFCKTDKKPKKLVRSASISAAKFWEKAKTANVKGGQVLMSCIECKILMDGLLIELKSQTKPIADDIKGGVCPKLPADFLTGCDDFLSLYMPTVLSMTMEQFTSEEICQGMHSCDQLSLTRLAGVSKQELESFGCEACRGVETMLAKEMGDSYLADSLISAAEGAVCARLPKDFQPLCWNLVESYIPKAMSKAKALLESDSLCQGKLHLCA